MVYYHQAFCNDIFLQNIYQNYPNQDLIPNQWVQSFKNALQNSSVDLTIIVHNIVVDFYRKSSKTCLVGNNPLINLQTNRCENLEMLSEGLSCGVIP